MNKLTQRPRLLFISRAYPPTLGGIENQNFALSQGLADYFDVTRLVNRRGKRFLPFFLPWVMLASLWLHRRYDIVLLGDCVLAINGWFIRKVLRKPVGMVVHGLDLTFRSRFYQWLWVRHAMRAISCVIAVSRATRDVAIQRGLDPARCTFIPNGIDITAATAIGTRNDLDQLTQAKTSNRFVILTLGRLVKRKGAAWFTDQVLPRLPSEVVFVIAGAGPEHRAIVEIIERKQLQDRVVLLGQVSEHAKQILLSNADLYVQPNLPVD